MKVSVCAHITYYYTAEIPDDATDFVAAADSEDPVYNRVSSILHKNIGSNYESNIVSVVDIKTGKSLYDGG